MAQPCCFIGNCRETFPSSCGSHRSPQDALRMRLLNLTLNPRLHSDAPWAGGNGWIDDATFGGHHALFLRNDHVLDAGGGSAPVTALVVMPPHAFQTTLRRRIFADFDFAPDLGARI